MVDMDVWNGGRHRGPNESQPAPGSVGATQGTATHPDADRSRARIPDIFSARDICTALSQATGKEVSATLLHRSENAMVTEFRADGMPLVAGASILLTQGFAEGSWIHEVSAGVGAESSALIRGLATRVGGEYREHDAGTWERLRPDMARVRLDASVTEADVCAALERLTGDKFESGPFFFDFGSRIFHDRTSVGAIERRIPQMLPAGHPEAGDGAELRVEPEHADLDLMRGLAAELGGRFRASDADVDWDEPAAGMAP